MQTYYVPGPNLQGNVNYFWHTDFFLRRQIYLFIDIHRQKGPIN